MFELLLAFSFLSSGADSNARIQELEKKMQALEERMGKIEATAKGGGFMAVPSYSCEINTPFDGKFESTQLSETAARETVMGDCRKNVKDTSQCQPLFVKCGNR